MRWRPSQTMVLVFSGTVTVMVGLSANLATDMVSAMPPWWKPVVWSLLGALTLLTLVLEVVKTRRSEPAGPLREAEEFLATAVRREWTDEAVLRGVFDPAPLPVQFHVTERKGISDHPAAGPTGDVTGIPPAFRSVPARRLVVLGEAGSGKSVFAMLLTKSLLEDRDPAEPVPILLPLASWDPGDHLHRWLKRHLAHEYPALTEKFGADVVARLVDEQRILPVLDGLDELEPAVRTDALRKINHALADSRATVVITCRANEFAQAVTSSRHMVSRAVVVELEPVPRDTALTFLGGDTAKDRWRAVADKMSEDGPLARVLGNPLMISLALTVYQQGSTRDPNELATATDPGAALLDRFVSGAYRADIPTAGATARRWSPAAAQRWLSSLANDVAKSDTKDLAWWRLRDRVPRATRVALVALGCAAITLPVFRLDLVVVFTVVCALAVGIPRYGPEPVRMRLQFGRGRRRLEYVLVGLGLGVLAGTVARNLTGLLLGGAVGLVAGVLAGSVTYREPDGAVTAQTTMRADRASSLRTGFVLAIAAGVAVWTASPGDPVTAIASAVLVFFLRWLALLTAFVYLAGLQLARQIWLAFGTEAAVVVSLGIASGVAALVWLMASRPNALAMTAWTQWLVLTRVWYPITRRLPWALAAFLADAHKRGVLHQVGSRYRFRHFELLNHLTHDAERKNP